MVWTVGPECEDGGMTEDQGDFRRGKAKAGSECFYIRLSGSGEEPAYLRSPQKLDMLR